MIPNQIVTVNNVYLFISKLEKHFSEESGPIAKIHCFLPIFKDYSFLK